MPIPGDEGPHRAVWCLYGCKGTGWIVEPFAGNDRPERCPIHGKPPLGSLQEEIEATPKK